MNVNEKQLQIVLSSQQPRSTYLNTNNTKLYNNTQLPTIRDNLLQLSQIAQNHIRSTITSDNLHKIIGIDIGINNIVTSNGHEIYINEKNLVIVAKKVASWLAPDGFIAMENLINAREDFIKNGNSYVGEEDLSNWLYKDLLWIFEDLKVEVKLVPKRNTSKACFFCGKIHNMDKQMFMSCKCGVYLNRNVNAALNIYSNAKALYY